MKDSKDFADKYFQQSSRMQNSHTKINIAFLYTNGKHTVKEIREIASFTIATKIIFWDNSNKASERFAHKNIKALKKEVEEDTRKWKTLPHS